MAEETPRFAELVQQAQDADLSDVADRGLIYDGGKAPDGLPIVVFVPSQLQAADADSLHRALLFFVKVMEPISRGGFHVVFCYSDVSWFSQGHFTYIRGVYGALPRTFRKNIKSLHILHPTATLRAFFFFIRPLLKRKFWRKFNYHAAVQSLRAALGTGFDLPESVLAFDCSEAMREAVDPEALAAVAAGRAIPPPSSRSMGSFFSTPAPADAQAAHAFAGAVFSSPLVDHTREQPRELPPLPAVSTMPGRGESDPLSARVREAVAAGRLPPLPLLLVRAVEALEAGGGAALGTEGLFRKSGSTETQNRVKAVYAAYRTLHLQVECDDGTTVEAPARERGSGSECLSRAVAPAREVPAVRCQPHDVAGLVKALLRATSLPLVPYSVQAALLREAPAMPNEDADPEPWLQEQGVAGGGSGDDSSVVVPTPATAANAGEAAAGVDRFCDAMRGHVRGLDRVAATLLWFLVGHLRRVLAYAPQTRMAARNLAIVFAPGLLRDPEDMPLQEVLQNTPKAIAAVYYLLRHADRVFDQDFVSTVLLQERAAVRPHVEQLPSYIGASRRGVRGGRFESVGGDSALDAAPAPQAPSGAAADSGAAE